MFILFIMGKLLKIKTRKNFNDVVIKVIARTYIAAIHWYLLHTLILTYYMLDIYIYALLQSYVINHDM